MPQDIYRTRERERRLAELAETPGRPPRTISPLPQGRLWPIMVALALLVFLFILGTIVVLQQRLIEEQREALQGGAAPESPATARQPVSVAPPSPTQSMEPSAQVVMDELIMALAERSPPGDEPPPLTVHWVQQAAYQLRQADMAYRRSAWSQAANAYRQALRIIPRLEDGEARLGLCLMRDNRFEEAAESFRRATEIQPKEAAHYCNLGGALLAQGRMEEAEGALRRALELNPEHLAAMRNLALLKFRAGDMAAAAEGFREFLKRKPDDFDAAHMLAIALIRLEKWSDAVSLLQESVRRWPDVPPVRFRLAQALAADGQGDAAIEALREGIGMIDPARALVWLSRPDFDLLRQREDFQQLIQSLPSRPR